MKIFVDPKSLLYLNGMTLDYKESLMQSGFVFENPNAKKSLRLRHVVFVVMQPCVELFRFLRIAAQAESGSQGPGVALLCAEPAVASGPVRAGNRRASGRMLGNATAILNDGYRTLKEPVVRAEYLLKQHGFDIGDKNSRTFRRNCWKKFSS